LLMMDAQETAAHFAERRAAIQGHCLVFLQKSTISAYSHEPRSKTTNNNAAVVSSLTVVVDKTVSECARARLFTLLSK
jgi:hypothetical protein